MDVAAEKSAGASKNVLMAKTTAEEQLPADHRVNPNRASLVDGHLNIAGTLRVLDLAQLLQVATDLQASCGESQMGNVNSRSFDCIEI